MYVYTSEEGTSEIVTIVEANDYTYTIDYDARIGSLQTEGKYFALYKKILSTIQLFSPS